MVQHRELLNTSCVTPEYGGIRWLSASWTVPASSRRRLEPVAHPARRPLGAPRHRPGLRVEHLQGTAREGPRALRHPERTAVPARDRDARPVRRGRRHAGGAQRPALGDARLAGVLLRRLPDLGARRGHRAVLAGRPRLRRHRRDRARHRLHLAGVDADQVVPGPAGNGDRHRDHGLRRRRADRVAVVSSDVGTRRTQGRSRPRSWCSASSTRCSWRWGWLLVRVPAEGWTPSGWTRMPITARP